MTKKGQLWRWSKYSKLVGRDIQAKGTKLFKKNQTMYNLETNALNRKTIVKRYSVLEDSAEAF